MHFLLTNDDSIHADGIRALRRAVDIIGGRCTVVAPATEQSMCGHRVTTYSPIKVEARGADEWAVHGTPADCVRIALFALNLEPDWVLSGVNHGGNLGQDAVISGTVAAAREAAYHGRRAVAFSHYLIANLAIDWERAAQWIAEIMTPRLAEPMDHGCFYNINLPHLPAGQLAVPSIQNTQLARSPLNVSFVDQGGGSWLYNARYSDRPRDVGSDVAACFGGDVSVSLLSI
jgi:5'-nucleotidase